MKPPFQISKILFFVCYLIVVIISAFYDKTYLKFMLPFTLSFIVLFYYANKKNKDLSFGLSMIALMICDYSIFSDMMTNFYMVCISISLFFIAICIALKNYFINTRLPWSKLISLSFFISIGLVLYLIISISAMIYQLIPNAVPFIVLAVLPLLANIIITYYIYVSDRYKFGGINLLFSSCLFILAVVLTPINELFYPSPVFTIFIASAQLIGVYIFTNFLVEMKPSKEKEVPINLAEAF